jgi:hypothetical protein
MPLFPGPVILQNYQEIPTELEEDVESLTDGRDAESYNEKSSTYDVVDSIPSSVIEAQDSDDGMQKKIVTGSHRTRTSKDDHQVSNKRASIYYLHPHDICNIGIMLSYFCVGFVLRVTQAPVQYYLIQYLNVSATIYSANNAFHRIPWTMKFIFGIISDAVPILGEG